MDHITLGHVCIAIMLVTAFVAAAWYDLRRNREETQFPKPPKKLLFWDRDGKLTDDSWEKL